MQQLLDLSINQVQNIKTDEFIKKTNQFHELIAY
jgi:hypothetical protein